MMASNMEVKFDEDEDTKNEPDLLSTILKWAPRVAAAAGVVAAGVYVAKEIADKEQVYPVAVDQSSLFQSFRREKLELKKDRVEKGHLAYIIKCLTDGISCNDKNDDGFAPLHLACQAGNISAVQAVLPFGPDLKQKTDCGQTSLEIVQNAQIENGKKNKKGYEVIEYMLKMVETDEVDSCPQPNWTLTEPEYNNYKINSVQQQFISYIPDPRRFSITGARVLCIDGGGTRGFVPLEFLDFMENTYGNNVGQPISIKHYFDWVAGTSTGGIIALFLALGNTVRECRNLYFRLKDKVFSGSKPYNAALLESELKTAYGEHTKMKDIVGIKCAITATTGTAEHLHRVIFANYDEKTCEEYVWKVARCTSAAPYFFDPYFDADEKMYYYDGGLTANNPTQAVLTEINRVEPNKIYNGLVVSIGTGKPPLSENLNLTVYKSSPMYLASMVQALLKTLVNQVSKSDGEVVEDAITTCSQAKCFYYRLTPSLPEIISLDETDNEKLLNMIFHTKGYIRIYRKEINEMCMRLLYDMERSGCCIV